MVVSKYIALIILSMPHPSIFEINI